MSSLITFPLIFLFFYFLILDLALNLELTDSVRMAKDTLHLPVSASLTLGIHPYTSMRNFLCGC